MITDVRMYRGLKVSTEVHSSSAWHLILKDDCSELDIGIFGEDKMRLPQLIQEAEHRRALGGFEEIRRRFVPR